MIQDSFQNKLSEKIDTFVHGVYDMSLLFPKDERFGVVSQIRRAALSVALNTAEGYARCSKAELSRFFKIAYGSLKETLYLIRFAHNRKWIEKASSEEIEKTGDEIGAMLWSVFSKNN